MSQRVPSPDAPLTVTLPVGGKVTVRAFPHDGRFLRDIRRAALAVANGATSEGELRELLEGALRAWYPRVEVRVREGLAALGDDDRVWYVMREGVLRNASERANRLYAALSDARATAEESDAAVGRAHETIAFASEPRRPSRATNQPVKAAAAEPSSDRL